MLVLVLTSYAPAQGALSDDSVWRLSVWRLTSVTPVGGRRVRPAGWMARIVWLKAAAARFRCRPGRGHIVVAVRPQLVWSMLYIMLALLDEIKWMEKRINLFELRAGIRFLQGNGSLQRVQGLNPAYPGRWSGAEVPEKLKQFCIL